MRDFLWKTVREGRDGSYVVHGFAEQLSGVLKGQTLRHYIASFPTREAALGAFPDAKDGHELLDPQVSLAHLPGEDDAQPGGMYPDDID